ncbi:MAG TPA: glucosyl transferase, partial [Ignavibacteriaceae bacterium]|nr:glucosyl transferase [Ignavibacteriaceae bacterium]
NNIWAVGEIYVADTSINGYTKYNAVHWNGNNWDLKRIPIDLNGYPFYPVIRSVFAFKENDIWFEAGIHWDGISFKQIPFNLQWSGNVNKLWGSSSSDLYAVGNNGNIARYYNGQWSRIETGTDINFRDIYGSINKDNNEVEIIALASNSGINQRKKIVRIKDQIVETLPDSGLADYLSTLWFISGRKYCIGGQGYYESETFGPVWERDDTKPPFHITTIRGAGLNDIALGGSFGLLMHYNGVNWINYAYITASYFDVITEVAIKGNTIVAAGFKGIKAVVMIGKR